MPRVIQRSGGTGDHWVGGTSILIGYMAYGPYNWAMRRVAAWANDSYSYDADGRQTVHAARPPAAAEAAIRGGRYAVVVK